MITIKKTAGNQRGKIRVSLDMDEIKPQSVLIKTNEILLKESGEWLHFAIPHQILMAKSLKEVLPALHEMERLVESNNWYAAGFLSYEAASAFEHGLRTHASTTRLNEYSSIHSTSTDDFPYLWFGLYPRPRVVTMPKPVQPKETLNWQPNVNRETYNEAITQIKNHIAKGRTYQVNYTMRLQAGFAGKAGNFFLHLAQGQKNYAAYVDIGRYVICSASPELFFQLEGDTITCHPMKGTVRRGRTTIEDQEQSEWLKNSVKNRAENVMIVDMVRNDLGRVAETGSVCVPELFTIERYPTLWQMTSTVTAKTSASLTDIFSALFPCASITGAPKVSTMKIINDLERTPRRVYTGSIGYISPQRKAKFNVAIRTALIDRESQQAEYGVGGGIVWDSTSTDEYAEALLKARVLTQEPLQFDLFETMLWTPETGFYLLDKHIGRMLDSADYFDISTSKQKLEDYLDQISSKLSSAQRIRLLLDQSGVLRSEAVPFQAGNMDQPLNVCLAKQPVDSGNVFLFHKTTRRDVYEWALSDLHGIDDVLLYNEVEELTEFTIGNLVVELDGKLFTPPVSCGVLPGTFRAYLLETGQVVERTISIQQLKDCTEIFRVNSIRKWQRVHMQG
jgi:para-aminobenzoate synthetase / 4-amino-4-deoxychorismate lyase